MDWFERITGFAETDYRTTRARLSVDDGHLVSDAHGARYAIGTFETPTLAALRHGAHAHAGSGSRTRVRRVVGDARALHCDPAFAGATFQVASQFNALEMVSPVVTPEHGVTRYADDRTQGPACAIAAGAATIWRNYFMPLDGGAGQTEARQLDTLRGLGDALSVRLARPVSALWRMRNGYALATADGLRDIGHLLNASSDDARDALRACLAVAWQRDAEVTDGPRHAGGRVGQVFCSALPVSYTPHAPTLWEPLARLVLEAAHEATLLAARRNAHDGGSNVVLLTRLGGGAFGNDDRWIDDAIERALRVVEHDGLDVCLVSYGSRHPSFESLSARWSAAAG